MNAASRLSAAKLSTLGREWAGICTRACSELRVCAGRHGDDAFRHDRAVSADYAIELKDGCRSLSVNPL
jgi:hypothetical protein